MYTTEVAEQLAQLKTADLAAFRAGVKSNHVLSFVRNELIKRAFHNDNNLQKETEILLSLSSASHIIASLGLLTKDGTYPKLLEKANIQIVDGSLKLTYLINAEGLSEDYKQRLNDKLNIQLAI